MLLSAADVDAAATAAAIAAITAVQCKHWLLLQLQLQLLLLMCAALLLEKPLLLQLLLLLKTQGLLLQGCLLLLLLHKDLQAAYMTVSQGTMSQVLLLFGHKYNQSTIVHVMLWEKVEAVHLTFSITNSLQRNQLASITAD